MELDLFIGRFHPLVVHLPIGFLLLAVILEFFSSRNQNSPGLNKAVVLSLIAGAIGAGFTVFTGLMLADEGGYDIDTLQSHKLLGITVLVLSVIGILLKWKLNGYNFWKSAVFSLAFMAVISLTGHYGGVLTHGETYLFDYAPGFVKKIAGIQENMSSPIESIHPDSVLVYGDFIQPLFNKKCVSCHSDDKSSGDLNLSSFVKMMEGGDDGSIINSTNPFQSELMRRVTLPPGHRKYMPPKGEVLSFSEIKVLEMWMINSPDTILKFSNMDIGEDLLSALERDYSVDFSKKPYFEKISIDPVSDEVLQRLRAKNFKVDFLSAENNLLSVGFLGDAITSEEIEVLNEVAGVVTWLKLASCDLTDELMQQLPEMTHLTRLDVHSNPLSGLSLDALKSSEHLETLNFHSTKLSDEGLEAALAFSSVKSIYVWQTNVSKAKVDEALSSNESVKLIKGFSWNN